VDRDALAAALLVLVAAQRSVERDAGVAQVMNGVGKRPAHQRVLGVQTARSIDRIAGVEGHVEGGLRADEATARGAGRQRAEVAQQVADEAPEQDRAVRAQVVAEVPAREDRAGLAHVDRPARADLGRARLA
jgi:hypothetical protein